jgi:hypothetical protein
MLFKIKHPCELCPFRKDVRPFLRRAQSIAEQMEDDHFWFACHETTGVKSGRRVRPAKQSHCAGLMGVLWKMKRPNIAMRLALMYKMITVKQLNSIQNVFNSLNEFKNHHDEEV